MLARRRIDCLQSKLLLGGAAMDDSLFLHVASDPESEGLKKLWCSVGWE